MVGFSKYGRTDANAVRLGASAPDLETAGFIDHQRIDIDVFIDGPPGRTSGGVHLLFEGERVNREDEAPCPTVNETEPALGNDAGTPFHVVILGALVRMKLTCWQRKDQVQLIDLINVGLIDNSRPARFPPALAARLQARIDNPNS